MSCAVCIASGKGGTGKTSVACGVASFLAAQGHSTVLLDADIGLRNLDLTLGLSDRAVFDFTDVMAGRVELGGALCAHPSCPGLFLLAAPLGIGKLRVTGEQMRALVERIKQEHEFCIIDAPAGIGPGFMLAAHVCDKAIIVATGEETSLRDARCTRVALRSAGISDVSLIVNRVRPKMIRKMQSANIDSAIDRAGSRLLGVVPEDSNVIIYGNRGELIKNKPRTPAARAYRNIADRLLGKQVKLFVR